MTLVEISEREVIEKAKAFFVESLESLRHFSDVEVDLLNAASLLIARETVEQSLDTGTVPIPRRPKKLSRKEQMAEARRQSDPTGRDREDVDYSSDDLPSAR